jgi:hypothetical protein
VETGFERILIDKKSGRKTRKMVQIDLPKSYLSLLALLGFGVVLAGSGFQGMTPDPAIARSGVSIILLSMGLWTAKNVHPKRKKRKLTFKLRRLIFLRN